MEQRTYTVYKFDELDQVTQDKVLHNYCDINVDHDWWQFTYEDAEHIGLKLKSFDLDRNRHAAGDFIVSAIECSEAILKEHGKECETHKTAKKYQDAIEALPDLVDEDHPDYDRLEREHCQAIDDIEADFLHSLLEDYSIILQNEYEHLTSREAIAETIHANDYWFNEQGKID